MVERETARAPTQEEQATGLSGNQGEITLSAGDFELPAAPEAIPAELANHPRYQVLRPLGAGGMGDVYLAVHRVMNRNVALKVINPALVRNPQMIERFQREVQAAARLSHPNIVTAFDAEQAGNLHFLCMEYVEGTDLTALVRSLGPLTAAKACHFMRQAALGLQHAHEKGMVHRDIKPHNIMLTGGKQIKILDFGLARFAREEDQRAEGLTATGSYMGTADYIAPEQSQDAHSADIRADIYSLGCTMYFLLTGKVPFEGGSAINKIMRHVSEQPTSIAELRPGMPADVVAAVERMMAKSPEDRFQTPLEVAKFLEPILRTLLGDKPAAADRPQGDTATALAVATAEPAQAAPTPAPKPKSKKASREAGSSTEMAAVDEPPMSRRVATRTVRKSRKTAGLGPWGFAGIGLVLLLAGFFLRDVLRPGGARNTQVGADIQSKLEPTLAAPNETPSPALDNAPKAAVPPKGQPPNDRPKGPSIIARPSSPTTTPTPPAAPPAGKPELVAIEGLPANAFNSGPWPSTDGLTLYWQSRPVHSQVRSIWSAERRDAASPFANARLLLVGNDPTVSADGLEMIFLAKGKLQKTTRLSTHGDFGSPQPIPEFDGSGFLAAPCLSEDGLTLHADRFAGNSRVELVRMTRSRRGDRWSPPTVIPVATPGAEAVRFYFPTDDRRWCFASLPGRFETHAAGNLLLLAGADGGRTFAAPRLIQIPGRTVRGQFPRYRAATRELYFSGPVDEKTGSSIFAIRNFDPATAAAEPLAASAAPSPPAQLPRPVPEPASRPTGPPKIVQSKLNEWKGSAFDYARYSNRFFEVGIGNEVAGCGFGEAGVEIEPVRRIAVALTTIKTLKSIDVNSFAGFVVDYHTPGGYTRRVALSTALHNVKQYHNTPPWGKWSKPDQFLSLGKKASYDIALEKWAPPDWDGRVWFTVRICNSGKNTGLRARITSLQ